VHRTSSPAAAAVFTLAVLATGCVASIREERVVGPDRSTPQSRQDVVRETRGAATTLVAKVDEDAIDVRVETHTECRDVRTTRDRVRDVDVVRSFADDAQERNVATTFLLEAAVGLVAYAANQATCPPSHGGCSLGATTAGEYALAGLSAVPLGFALYNWGRVYNDRVVEPAPPLVESGAWAACGSAPAAGDSVDVIVDDAVFHRTTDPDGRAVVDLGALSGGPPASRPRRVVVRHTGTVDVVLGLPASGN
jgi:hypothetical protein